MALRQVKNIVLQAVVTWLSDGSLHDEEMIRCVSDIMTSL